MGFFEIVSLLILSLVGVRGNNRTFNMYRDAGLNNYDCNNGEYAFSLVATRSKITCAHQCDADATCKSMFYVPGTTSGTCNGCSTRYISTDIATLGINTLQGSVYYYFPTFPTFDFVWDDSGYIFIDTQQDFASGTNLCNGLGGYPVAIETEAENDFISARLLELNIGRLIYVGLHQPGGVGTDWIWQGTGQVMTYNGFHTNEPNYDSELCVGSYSIDMAIYKWADILCSRNEYMLCEINI